MSTTTVEWPRKRKKPTVTGPFALLHQFSHDVINGRDVIRIHRMAQPEAVGQESGAQEKPGAHEMQSRRNTHTAILGRARIA